MNHERQAPPTPKFGLRQVVNAHGVYGAVILGINREVDDTFTYRLRGEFEKDYGWFPEEQVVAC